MTTDTISSPGRRRPGKIAESRTECLTQPKQEWLCDLYGLTRVEADITARICRGQAPEAIAQALRIGIHTVRGHLKDIFLKMGVQRQSGVVRQVFVGLGQL